MENTSVTDPTKILCRVVDVEAALARSFQRFVEEKRESLDDLIDLSRQELSKMELFLSNSDE